MNKKIKLFVPPGHFYSPIPDLEEIRNNENKIFSLENKPYGVDLNNKEQIRFFKKFQNYYKELPFSDNKKNGLLYYYKNPAFSYGDAISLYSMIRTIKPKRIIEIGCGFSSCVTLDTNRIFFNNSIKCKFIEPFPELLNKLTEKVKNCEIEVINKKLQDVDIKEFDCLSKNDILFIDSTHVSKINSDVNYIFFKLLSNIKKGVYIHFHDIFYPFEYPKDWVYEGRAWNELYMLGTFLQFNKKFKIVFFNNYIVRKYKEEFGKHMPLYMRNIGGSIWLKKISNTKKLKYLDNFTVKNKIEKIQILGQRCSGTNYLEGLTKLNFKNIKKYQPHGWKHGFLRDVGKSNENVLFLVIYRNPFDWIRSLYKNPHHLYLSKKKLSFSEFIRQEWKSIYNKGAGIDVNDPKYMTEIKGERNPETGKRFKNPFEIRSAKIKHYISLKQKVDNIYYIKLEELQNNYIEVLKIISEKYEIMLKNRKILNIEKYKGLGERKYKPTMYDNIFDSDLKFIRENLDWKLENKIGYYFEDYCKNNKK